MTSAPSGAVAADDVDELVLWDPVLEGGRDENVDDQRHQTATELEVEQHQDERQRQWDQDHEPLLASDLVLVAAGERVADAWWQDEFAVVDLLL